MTLPRMVGLVVVVFLVSLPAMFLRNADLSAWQFFAEAPEVEDAKEDKADTVVDLLCIKAMKEMSDSNYDKAVATYTKAIARDPKYSFAYLGRGDVHVLRGDFDRAVQDYNQAYRLDPSNTAAKERLDLVRKAQAEK